MIGPHGQGMAHVAYCNEGTFVWELFPEIFITASTIGISATNSLKYMASSFPPINPGDDGQTADFYIDVDFVEKKVREMGL